MSAVLNQPVRGDGAPAPFGEAMDRAEHDKERVVVTRDGRPVAALVPIEDVATLEALEDAEDAAAAQRAFAEWEAAGRPVGATLEDLAARWGIDLAPEAE